MARTISTPPAISIRLPSGDCGYLEICGMLLISITYRARKTVCPLYVVVVSSTGPGNDQGQCGDWA